MKNARPLGRIDEVLKSLGAGVLALSAFVVPGLRA
jgi:hypothetical protein